MDGQQYNLLLIVRPPSSLTALHAKTSGFPFLAFNVHLSIYPSYFFFDMHGVSLRGLAGLVYVLRIRILGVVMSSA